MLASPHLCPAPLALLLLLSVAPLPGAAQQPPATEEPRAYSRYYTGAFYEVGARALRSAAGDSQFGGWGWDAGLRASFPMYLGDLRLAYRFDALQAERDGVAAIDQHSVGLTLAIHPLFLFLLGSDWPSYVVASTYLEVGAGGQWASLVRALGQAPVDDEGFWWSLGVGVDLPLWDPDVGYAPWLTVLYRNHRGDFDVSDEEAVSLSLHALIVGLAWRINGLPF